MPTRLRRCGRSTVAYDSRNALRAQGLPVGPLLERGILAFLFGTVKGAERADAFIVPWSDPFTGRTDTGAPSGQMRPTAHIQRANLHVSHLSQERNSTRRPLLPRALLRPCQVYTHKCMHTCGHTNAHHIRTHKCAHTNTHACAHKTYIHMHTQHTQIFRAPMLETGKHSRVTLLFPLQPGL